MATFIRSGIGVSVSKKVAELGAGEVQRAWLTKRTSTPTFLSGRDEMWARLLRRLREQSGSMTKVAEVRKIVIWQWSGGRSRCRGHD